MLFILPFSPPPAMSSLYSVPMAVAYSVFHPLLLSFPLSVPTPWCHSESHALSHALRCFLHGDFFPRVLILYVMVGVGMSQSSGWTKRNLLPLAGVSPTGTPQAPATPLLAGST